MQPAGYGGLDHERTPLQRPRFSRQAVLAAPLFAAVAGLVILVVLELAPESALHRASLASALQAPITADHHHRNITSAAPHIVLAVLDDAGWDDWLETSDLAAPHVAALAESGLSLRSHYAAHECTPSRGSLLSGRYPTAGYRTALVGKWHLGHYNESLTPARRGFGESYGFLGGFVDHFTHVAEAPPACASETPATDGTCALDWQVNGLPRPRATGVYAAYACRDAARRLVASHEGKEEPLFLYYALPTPHEPITPPDDVETYDLLPKLDVAGRRRDYAAVVAATDGAIGDLQAALQKHALWPNTLLVLLSDNGASAAGGSNAPLRGAKGGYFEGGVRTRALLAGSLLPQNVRGSSHEASSTSPTGRRPS
ncbi:sulfuric ester hydrolase [Aureococcus anophagefferens]|nr:sulfuric ester hydrolase [Aureococcus anophagefferens]